MSIERALLGWHLVTARIFYFHPDKPKIINPNWFLWQHDDLPPEFPHLNSFLKWWTTNLDGRIHSVQVMARGLIQPTDLRHYGSEFKLN